MKSRRSETRDFAPLATYRPREALKLVECLQSSGIAYRAETVRPGQADCKGPTTVVEVSVDPQKCEQANRIHIELFGDGLPNYDSSFFQQHRNV
jgi:hypothetical protein